MKRQFKILTFLLLAGCFSATYANPYSKSMKKLVDKSLQFSVEQSMSMNKTMINKEGQLPRTTKDGKLKTVSSKDWTSGFFPGTLWYCYEYSSDKEVRKAAELMSARVEQEKYTTSNHDVGFIIYCSFGNGYRLTHNKAYPEIIETTAKSLCKRFNKNVGCTRSWGSMNSKEPKFTVIIDNMMNLEMLTAATALTGNKKYQEVAIKHADTTMKNHFRPDYSSYHVVNYNANDGSVMSKKTSQGYADDSSWARGQGWGLYGYTMMYRQTGKKEYLNQAIEIGKYIMNHPNMPKDKVPYWDFNAPGQPDCVRDASAAAIMASAYLELSTYVEDKELSNKFFSLAELQIKSLSSKKYRAKKVGDNNNFILKHSTGHFSINSEVDEPLVYADYYYVEALIRYKNISEGHPVVEKVVRWNR